MKHVSPSVSYFKNLYWGYPLVVKRLRLHLLVQGMRVQSLVGKLRSHMSGGQKTQNIKQKQYWNKVNKDLRNSPHQKMFLRIYIKGFYSMVLLGQNSRLES